MNSVKQSRGSSKQTDEYNWHSLAYTALTRRHRDNNLILDDPFQESSPLLYGQLGVDLLLGDEKWDGCDYDETIPPGLWAGHGAILSVRGRSWDPRIRKEYTDSLMQDFWARDLNSSPEEAFSLAFGVAGVAIALSTLGEGYVDSARNFVVNLPPDDNSADASLAIGAAGHALAWSYFLDDPMLGSLADSRIAAILERLLDGHISYKSAHGVDLSGNGRYSPYLTDGTSGLVILLRQLERMTRLSDFDRLSRRLTSGLDTLPAAQIGLASGWSGIRLLTPRTADAADAEVARPFFNQDWTQVLGEQNIGPCDTLGGGLGGLLLACTGMDPLRALAKVGMVPLREVTPRGIPAPRCQSVVQDTESLLNVGDRLV